jgi:transcriptional regulator with XRE-family HTH domain
VATTTKERIRYPAGTWMRLESGAKLRKRMNDEKRSLADVARYAGVSRGFISHLTAGREKTCTPRVAHRIAEIVDRDVEELFQVHVPPAGCRIAKSQASRAA